MVTKNWLNNSFIFHLLSISCIAILLSLLKSDFFYLKFDGNTFYVTGLRILEGNIATIYESIVGSGPYTYSPYSSLFFALFAFIGKHSLQWVCLAALYFSFLVLFRNIKAKYESINLKVLLVLSVLTFSSVIFESLYIGQIDSLILFLLVVAFLSTKNVNIAILLISLTTLFKPQFFIFILIFYFLKKEQLRGKNFIQACLFFMIPHILFLFLLLIAIGGSSEVLKNLFISFFRNSRMISGNIDVTNQSLSAVLNRLLSTSKFEGRYFPEIFAPKSYSFETLELSPLLVRAVYFSLLILIFIFLLKKYKPKYRSSDNLLALALLLLPSLSPLFWQVHAIFLIPGFLFIAAAILKNSKSLARVYLGLYLLLMLISNPILFGGQLADLSLAFGSTYAFSIVSVYFLKKYHLDFNFK